MLTKSFITSYVLGAKVSDGKSIYVILLNYNGWCDTLHAIESLKEHCSQALSILVVDNASTDESLSHLNAAKQQFELLPSASNLGFSGGCNIGIRHALQKGASHIWLLNNDTVIDGETLDGLLNCAQTHGLDAVGSVIYELHDPETVQAWGGGRVIAELGLSWHLKKRGIPDYLSGASIMLSARAINEIGFLDEDYFMYWEDVDYCLRLQKAGFKLGVAADSKVWHEGSASLKSNRDLLHRLRGESLAIFLRKHAKFPLASVIVSLLLRSTFRILSGNARDLRPFLEGAWVGKKKLISSYDSPKSLI